MSKHESDSAIRKDLEGLRQDLKVLSTTVDQTSRMTAQLLDHVGKLRGEMGELREDMRAGDEALREEMRAGHAALRAEMSAGDAALREEMRAGDEALREEMRTGLAEQGARLDAIHAEQQALRSSFSEMSKDWSSAKDAAQRTARHLGHETVWDWITVADGRIRNTEDRLGRLERSKDVAG